MCYDVTCTAHMISYSSCDVLIQAAVKEDKNNLSLLDHYWVAGMYLTMTSCAHMTLHDTDWLTDIGLAQYRDIFIDGLVDGNMLNELTYV